MLKVALANVNVFQPKREAVREAERDVFSVGEGT